MVFQSLTLLYTVIWYQQSLSAGNVQQVEIIQVWLDLLETRQLLYEGIVSSKHVENLSTNLDLFLFPLGVNLLVGTESGLMLLDRSGQGKVYPLINRRRFQQMDVLEGLNVLVTISGNVNCSMWFFLHLVWHGKKLFLAACVLRGRVLTWMKPVDFPPFCLSWICNLFLRVNHFPHSTLCMFAPCPSTLLLSELYVNVLWSL